MILVEELNNATETDYDYFNSLFLDITDDIVTIPAASQTNFGTSDFGVGFKIFIPSGQTLGTSRRNIIAKYLDASNYYQVAVQVSGVKLRIVVSSVIGGVTKSIATSADQEISYNCWNTIGSDKESTGLSAFVNGVYKKTASTISENLTIAAPWVINKDNANNTTGRKISMYIDDLCIFNQAVGETEWNKFHNGYYGRDPKKMPGCVAHYSCNEETGTAITGDKLLRDSTTYLNHGTISGYGVGSVDFVNHYTLLPSESEVVEPPPPPCIPLNEGLEVPTLFIGQSNMNDRTSQNDIIVPSGYATAWKGNKDSGLIVDWSLLGRNTSTQYINVDSSSMALNTAKVFYEQTGNKMAVVKYSKESSTYGNWGPSGNHWGLTVLEGQEPVYQNCLDTVALFLTAGGWTNDDLKYIIMYLGESDAGLATTSTKKATSLAHLYDLVDRLHAEFPNAIINIVETTRPSTPMSTGCINVRANQNLVAENRSFVRIIDDQTYLIPVEETEDGLHLLPVANNGIGERVATNIRNLDYCE